MPSVIKQIVTPGAYDTQTIKMIVKANERGPQGEQGEAGQAATIEAGNVYPIEYEDTPYVMNVGTESNAKFDFYLPKGQPGVIHYTAGPGINISDSNVISATGGMAVHWGEVIGTLSDQTDLQNALNAKQNVLTAGSNINITGDTISATDTTYTACTNVSISDSNVISATDTTYSDFAGADGVSAGSAGLVPAPVATANNSVLIGNGTWGTINTSNVTDSAITTAKINNSAVTSAKIDFSTLGFANYSYSEKDTGLTWVDGKHIYMKTVSVGAIPNNTASVTVHDIANLGTIVKVDGIATNGTTSTPLPFVSSSNALDCIEVTINTTDVDVTTHTGYWNTNNYAGFVTLWYTKSS